MNVLLMTSPIPDRLPFGKSERSPPLGLGFLISVLRRAGHKVYFVDHSLGPSDVLESDILARNRIDCVGIQAPSLFYSGTLIALHKLQQMRERGKWKGTLVVGGPHPTVCPDAVPDFVDFVVQGEGEPAIVDAVEGRGPRLVRHPRIKDLDTLPRPAYDCFASMAYDFSVPDLEARPVFTMNTSRGCPHSCSFCSVGSIWGRKYTTFSPERIVDDIKFLQRTYGVRGINFREDNFVVILKRVREMCELMLREGLEVSWRCEARAGRLDRETLALMKRAGCETIYIGAESGSQRVLDLMNKGITVEDTTRTVAWCKELGIKVFATFLAGFPGETPKERVETVAFVERLQLSRHSWGIYYGMPGTEAYVSALANNGFAYVSEVGVGYVHGHDRLVDEIFGGREEWLVPWPDGVKPSEEQEQEKFDPMDLRDPVFRRKLAAYRRLSGRAHLVRHHRGRAMGYYLSAIRNEPSNLSNWKALANAMAGRRLGSWLSRVFRGLRGRRGDRAGAGVGLGNVNG